jgi:hypothetical protein
MEFAVLAVFGDVSVTVTPGTGVGGVVDPSTTESLLPLAKPLPETTTLALDVGPLVLT